MSSDSCTNTLIGGEGHDIITKRVLNDPNLKTPVVNDTKNIQLFNAPYWMNIPVSMRTENGSEHGSGNVKVIHYQGTIENDNTQRNSNHYFKNSTCEQTDSYNFIDKSKNSSRNEDNSFESYAKERYGVSKINCGTRNMDWTQNHSPTFRRTIAQQSPFKNDGYDINKNVEYNCRRETFREKINQQPMFCSSKQILLSPKPTRSSNIQSRIKSEQPIVDKTNHLNTSINHQFSPDIHSNNDNVNTFRCNEIRSTSSPPSNFRSMRVPAKLSYDDKHMYITSEEVINIKNEDATETVVNRKTIKKRPMLSKNIEPLQYPPRKPPFKLNEHNYLNERDFTTLVQKQPTKTHSQLNVNEGYNFNERHNQWTSESNIYSSNRPSKYSAHKENMRLNAERDRKFQNERHISKECVDSSCHETRMESISLQPIGKGVHDLHNSVGTLPRAMSHPGGTFGGSQMRFNPSSGAQTPLMQNGRETRSRTVHKETVWQNSSGFSPTSTPRPPSSIHNIVDYSDGNNLIVQVNSVKSQWFLPNEPKEQAFQLLSNRDPGSFIIRESVTKPHAYNLMVRTPYGSYDRESVKSFLISKITTATGNIVYQLTGFSNQKQYNSLEAFVSDHCINQGVLPCCLHLPIGNQSGFGKVSYSSQSQNRISGNEFLIDVLYLGSADVYPAKGYDAVKMCADQLLSHAYNPNKGLKKKCEAIVRVNVGKSVTITDISGVKFTEKKIMGNKILFCGFDPKARPFNSLELNKRGMENACLFGIVTKKKFFNNPEHAVHMMCQLDPHQPIQKLDSFIKHSFIIH